MDATATTPVVRHERRVAARRSRIRFGAPGLVLCGLGLLLLGAWGGIVPFVGPKFGFGPVGAPAWQWTNANVVLNVVPGVAAVLAGLAVMGSASWRALRGLAAFGSLLAVGAGAWFVLGELVYPVFYGTAPVWGGTAGNGALAQFVTRLGYGMGVGLALCLLGGMALALIAARRAEALITRESMVAEDVAAPPATV
ncbi:MAG TPA: hypothetical protein VFA11_15550 [Acidimicrobiales bacterium]|nr:hypothetical protein [Acidimicrobiales bacterium]